MSDMKGKKQSIAIDVDAQLRYIDRKRVDHRDPEVLYREAVAATEALGKAVELYKKLEQM